MQKAFTLTEEMSKELAAELEKPAEDPREIFGSVKIRKRITSLQNGEQSQQEPLAEPDQTDPVNHPKHYTSHPSGVECITVTEWMSFNLGSAVKYIWRAGLKGYQMEDLMKARWYIDREIKRLGGE